MTLAMPLVDPLKARGVMWLGEMLENRVSRTSLATDAPITGIIALGGAVTRVQEAVALSKRFPGARLVLSGPGKQEIDYARERASGDHPLIFDRRATTTFENAWYSRNLVRPEEGERWIVVTSAVHMPRALASFRAVGFSVEPWPVYDASPTRAAFGRAVEHEIIGLVYYWLCGRAHLTA